tara:strand:- start:39 stop:347 length:309 start_codon:yes stop_codon:yes gene_type:complete
LIQLVRIRDERAEVRFSTYRVFIGISRSSSDAAVARITLTIAIFIGLTNICDIWAVVGSHAPRPTLLVISGVRRTHTDAILIGIIPHVQWANITGITDTIVI